MAEIQCATTNIQASAQTIARVTAELGTAAQLDANMRKVLSAELAAEAEQEALIKVIQATHASQVIHTALTGASIPVSAPLVRRCRLTSACRWVESTWLSTALKF